MRIVAIVLFVRIEAFLFQTDAVSLQSLVKLQLGLRVHICSSHRSVGSAVVQLVGYSQKSCYVGIHMLVLKNLLHFLCFSSGGVYQLL